MAEPTAEASASASAPAAASTSTSAPAPTPAPTVLTTLHTLLRAHVAAHPSPTLPYLHPFAPAPRTAWKGKARASLPSAEEQVAQLRAVKEAVEGARGVLARGRDDKERVRAARAMREVITHESALLPLGSTLSSLPPAPRPLAAIAPLPPAELLSALGKRLGLQVFAEDSQFGLLKTSLTLAGERFVVDIDLEADAGDDMDEDEGTEPPSLAPTPGLGGASLAMSAVVEDKDEDKKVAAAQQPTAERGKVRLAKLSANHVTPSGADGKNEHVARVLRAAVGAHLAAWNTRPCSVKLEGACAALEAALAELKALDELAAAGAADSADLFADLEALSAGVAEAVAKGEVYEDASARLYPSFRLLSTAEGLENPAIRIRPVARGENVPPAWAADEGMAVDAAPEAVPAAVRDEAMVVDGADAPATNGEASTAAAAPAAANGAAPTPGAMAAGAWLLEVVDNLPTPAPGGRGLIVRRTWLLPDVPTGADDTDANTWIGSIKAEGLLYQLALESSGAADAALPVFPQGSAFVHRAAADGGLAQRWSLAQPGPEGYVVGRVGVPRSWAEFGRLVRVLRAQAVLDALVFSAFPPSAVDDSEGDGDDNDDDDIDLDAPPSALAVTATLHQRSVRISLPLDLANPESPMLSLELSPAAAPPYVAAAVSGIDDNDAQRTRVDDALGPALSLDAVALVSSIVAALLA
ncbi:uncharacterized protein LOC62_01G000843 [Vanrija pseudolonga]|uniref:Uncharacterized protein n=1 Tax=Vanrija pseudolonga TaxID=143232 RepID=A0AAF1BH91_9TREE|nr:hypothetical protein LOC62_01G000843 [Vanrija pseudolonga]